MNIIVATIKSWNIKEFDLLKKKLPQYRWFLVTDEKQLKLNKISDINPDYIFFPHWSWIIPKQIWNQYECVVFHMTDLPYGRGGTPLQNLIMKGQKKTKISALKVNQKVDGGHIYLKKPLSLIGSASEIFKRAAKTVFRKMIPEIIDKKLKPKKQIGKVVKFKRLGKRQSKIRQSDDLKTIYNRIRMLDAEGYPKASFNTNKLRFEFEKAIIKDKIVVTKAKIYEK